MDTPIASLPDLLARQRAAWRAAPPDYAQRDDDLRRLRVAFKARLNELARALDADFGCRPHAETLLADGVPVLGEIDHVRRRLCRWMRPRRVATDWSFLPARCHILPKPVGVVGIISPWNYPINLALVPLVDALAAGNHVLLKPSEQVPRTAAALADLLATVFAPERVAVVQGGSEVAAAFAALPFDHLLYTGSGAVAAKVLAAAAPHLTPVTLELGGKSPALVAPGGVNARNVGRIAAGKFLNAGQTCIAPDYVLLHADEREAFVALMRAYVDRHYPAFKAGFDFASIVNAAQHARLRAALEQARAAGARLISLPSDAAHDPARRILAPTLVLDAPEHLALLQEEVFGPILPLVSYTDFEAAIDYVNARPRPLALYLFDADRARVHRTLAACIAGGVAVNDCVWQFAQKSLPFGGSGASGMGAYHGLAGFNTFSKLMPVFTQARWSAATWLRPPWGKWAKRLLCALLH